MSKLKTLRLPIYYLAWLVGGFFSIVLLVSSIVSIFTAPNIKENHAQLFFFNKLYCDIYQIAGIKGLSRKLDQSIIIHTKVIIIDNNQNLLYDSKTSWKVNSALIEKAFVSENNAQQFNIKSSLIAHNRYNFVINTMGDSNRLIVVQKVGDINSELNHIPWQMWLFITFCFVVALSGVYIGFYVKRRLTNINNSCLLIFKQGDLSKRLQRDGSNTDFDILAKNLNFMLNHIEQLIQDIKQTSDNIAHDLRTPLTNLLNKLENANCRSFSSNELQIFHHELQQELENMNRIFNALLRISKIEANHNAHNQQELNIKQLLTDILEFYAPLTEDKHQHLSLESKTIKFIADRDLICQAITNCLDNAIKYTPEYGRIALSAISRSNNLVISISDNGIGIPIAEHYKVFQRLYRVEKSRSTPGTGLGLSLVKAISEYHNGSVNIIDNQPGVIIQIIIPIKQK